MWVTTHLWGRSERPHPATKYDHHSRLLRPAYHLWAASGLPPVGAQRAPTSRHQIRSPLALAAPDLPPVGRIRPTTCGGAASVHIPPPNTITTRACCARPIALPTQPVRLLRHHQQAATNRFRRRSGCLPSDRRGCRVQRPRRVPAPESGRHSPPC